MATLTTEYVAGLIAYWQKVLNIRHWRVEFKVIAGEGRLRNSLMEIRPTRIRHYALIIIKAACLELPKEQFEPLVVHELVHLVYDPLAEEHSIQVQYDKDEERRTEHKDRFVRTLEKCVEHTAHMLSQMTIGEGPTREDAKSIVVYTKAMLVQYVDQKLADDLGYETVFDLIGKPIQVINPSITPETIEAKLTILTAHNEFEYTTEVLNASGELVPVHITNRLSPAKNQDVPQIISALCMRKERRESPR